MSPLQRNLPIILAAVLSALLHVFVLFPAIGILGLGSARDDDGLVRSGLDGDEGDAAEESDETEELDRAKPEEEIRSRERAALAAAQATATAPAALARLQKGLELYDRGQPCRDPALD